MVTLGAPLKGATPKGKRPKPDFSKYGDLYLSPEERGSTYHHRPDIKQFIHEEVTHQTHRDVSPNTVRRRSKEREDLMEAMEGEMEPGRREYEAVEYAYNKAAEAQGSDEDEYVPEEGAIETDAVGPIGSPTRKGVYSLPTRAPEQRFPLNLHSLPVVRGPAGKRENSRTVADVYGASFGVQVGNKQAANAPKHSYTVVGLGTNANASVVGML
jgi:hypothetical protein